MTRLELKKLRSFLRDESGRVHSLLGFVHDVTERAEARLELSRSEARFRSFFDQAPAAVFIKDKDSRHLYGNRVAAEYAGSSLDRFLGATAFDLFTPEVAETLVRLDRKVLRKGQMVSWTGPVQVPTVAVPGTTTAEVSVAPSTLVRDASPLF